MTDCRFCKSKLDKPFLDLGKMPLANGYLNKNELESEEHMSPLRVFLCQKCFLMQIEDFEIPSTLFQNYTYFSSYSKTWLEHAEEYVKMIIKKMSLQKNQQVIEIASNDGYLLQFFKKDNFPILGIEPAKNIALVAREKGIPTISEFFGTELANKLIKKGINADLLLGNNVLAHVPNLNDFIKGMKILLKKNGIITLEFPHLLQLIKKNQFDTIYHEHFSYFSLVSLLKIFSFHNLEIFDVEEISTHGGSLRIFVKHPENMTYKKTSNVEKLIQIEEEFRLKDIKTYENFSDVVKKTKKELTEFLELAKKNNKRIVCYGAAAKGNTLLNYCQIGKEFIDYIVDKNIHKQGMYLPGTHIQIKDPNEILKTKPDYVIILPWNLKEEIMNEMNLIKNWGGRFVTLIPHVEIYQ